jgi:uncharacterized protein
MSTQPGSDPEHTNRLANESSPYLLQHAHNPVDWYPWGPEAFEKARREDKPIFLSVGYSTCYWCHVMERQSFENEQIAEEMNKRFVCIKVDREERPDVDQLYMIAVQVLTRHGGWPMSVFLTPDLKPFYGGTYFPPTDQQGRAGFLTVIRGIDDAWKNRREEVTRAAEQLVGILQQVAEPPAPAEAMTIDFAMIDRLIERSTGDYEPRYGGFGGAPKFPRQTLLELLLVYLRTPSNDPSARLDNETIGRKERVGRMLRHTLDAMADGGIRDHLGGAFHRYSTDARWLVPHFEIMLYDNAMLAWVYVEAYRQFEERRYAKVARGILDFVLREMTSAAGAFYTAIDAEVDAEEGKSYLWTAQEIEQVLGAEDAKVFNKVYGVDQGPNFADPHHGTGQPDKNILYLPRQMSAAAEEMGMEEDELEERLGPMREKLYEARRGRKQPLLDRKVLTSWNALMIRAMASAGETLQEQRYLDAAARAADFLLRRHRVADGALIRTSGGGLPGEERPPRRFQVPASEEYVSPVTPDVLSAGIEPPDTAVKNSGTETIEDQPAEHHRIGFLDDYAFLIHALIGLRNASGHDYWKDHAAELAMAMIDRFGDRDGGAFFYTDRHATDLIVRQKIGSDSPLPSGNAAAAMAMQGLGQAEETRRTLAAFAEQMSGQGEAMSAMVEAALLYLRQEGPVEVAAAPRPREEDRPLSPQQLAERVVSIRAAWRNTKELSVHINLLKGFHINSNQPQQGLIATQLAVQGDSAALVEAIEYPPGEEQRFAFVEQPIHVYVGEVIILVRFSQPMTDADPVKLALSYQPCDEEACLPPVTKQLEVNTP